MSAHISRWDLDKTYLRTEFDTMGDLVRTAFERADEKRTNPGAATSMRELAKAGVEIHLLSGSPEQMRRRLEAKLRLDGIVWNSFVLKPNLKNLLRLRFRAVRDQLGYKLPALLEARARIPEHDVGLRETLFGDDAEADAFVYSLYADILEGRIGVDDLRAIGARARLYDDVLESVTRSLGRVAAALIPVRVPVPVVERIFIHLERQSPPGDFDVYGPRIVPFYNYLQCAFVLQEDTRLPAQSVLEVATELIAHHRFDGEALARSYHDLGKRGHLRGTHVGELNDALKTLIETDKSETANATGAPCIELRRMVERLSDYAVLARQRFTQVTDSKMPDYLSLVGVHTHRKREKRRR